MKNIIEKYNLKEEIMKNLDIVQKYESGWFDMEYGDESHDEGFWDISYEIAGTYDNPDQENIYYALKELCGKIINYNKCCNVKFIIASKNKKKLTLLQRKEIENETN